MFRAILNILFPKTLYSVLVQFNKALGDLIEVIENGEAEISKINERIVKLTEDRDIIQAEVNSANRVKAKIDKLLNNLPDAN